MTNLHEPVFEVLSDEIFTDREGILAILKRIAYGAKRQQFFSPVLIGHRRMGKTEVLKKLYNELFWEQVENPDEDGDEVVPIYITFEELSRESRQFARQYLTFFLSQYIGFKRKDANFIKEEWQLHDILEPAQGFAESQKNHGLLRLLKSTNRVITFGASEDNRGMCIIQIITFFDVKNCPNCKLPRLAKFKALPRLLASFSLFFSCIAGSCKNSQQL